MQKTACDRFTKAACDNVHKVVSSAMSLLCGKLPLPTLVEEGVCASVCGQADACVLIDVFLD